MDLQILKIYKHLQLVFIMTWCILGPQSISVQSRLDYREVYKEIKSWPII